jgi:hypothetical protein
VANRESYQDAIDRDRRDEQGDAAEPASRGEPPHARPGYRRRRDIDRALARYYEECKADTAKRLRNPRRQKQYCAAVAWKRVEQSGRFADYPAFARREPGHMKRTPPRNPRTGRFLKRSSTAGRTSKRARASESPSRRRTPARRAAAASPRRAPRRSRGREAQRRSAPRRSPRRTSGRGRSGQTNIAIVPVGVAKEPRRRGRGRGRARMYEPVLAGAGAVSLFVTAAVIGDLIADALDRYIAGYDPATSPVPALGAPYTVDNPIPKWNNDSAAMQPGIARLAAQIVPALIFFLLGGVTRGAALKFFLYGMGGGFAVHAGRQIITAYIIVPMVKSSTSTGARMYQHEMNVYNGLANPSGGILGAGPMNRPHGRGMLGAGPGNQPASPPQLPSNQPAARVPVALATQASPPAAAAAPAAQPAPAQQAAPAMMGQPPAQQHPSGCRCTACPQPAAGNGAGPGPHPLWSVLLDRRAA